CSECHNRPAGRRKYLACSDLRVTARQIIIGYRLRWAVELFHKKIVTTKVGEDPDTLGLYCISEAGIKGLPSKASLMASKTFLAFFRAVERYPRMRPKRLAPSSVRNPPETFCLTFTIRISRSPWLLSNGIRKSDMNANTWPLKSRRRMSKFTGGACLGRPRFLPSPLFVSMGAGFASTPARTTAS